MTSTLSILALKTAPDVFDLSSGLVHVSIRDQIVRARLLVRDLDAAMPARKKLLIVGAGIAGVAAACAAATHGYQVVVLDTREVPISLQGSTKKRYIGPHMYEWPSAFYADQRYPGPDPLYWPGGIADCPEWGAQQPVNGQEFASQVRQWLAIWLHSAHPAPYRAPMFLMNVTREHVSAFVKDSFVPAAIAAKGQPAEVSGIFNGKTWPDGGVIGTSFAPDFVLLAAGMGAESTTLPGAGKVSGPAFWSDEFLGTADESLAVFGTGDGALQDVLCALTKFEHPLRFIDHLQKTAAGRKALLQAEKQLGAVEAQHRLMSSWTVGKTICKYVDSKCVSAAQTVLPHLIARVRSALRQGSGKVWLISKSDHVTKAYMLNRFVFHLVRLCIEHDGPSASCRPFVWCLDTQVVEAKKKWGYVQVTLDKPPKSIVVDYVAVRFGLGAGEEDGPAGQQLVGISKKKSAKRTTLAQVPLPYVVA